MCTAMRIVRGWSAIERVIAWRIHQVAVGRELVTAPVFEFVDCLHQPDIAFLDQVEELRAAVRIFLGDRNEEPQVASTISFLARLASRSPRCTVCTTRRNSAIGSFASGSDLGDGGAVLGDLGS